MTGAFSAHIAQKEVEHVGTLVRSLLTKRKRQLALPELQARKHLARELKCAEGTLRGYADRTVKNVKGWLRDRIEACLIAEIKADIRRLQREHNSILTGRHRHAALRDVAAIEADLAALKALLGLSD